MWAIAVHGGAKDVTPGQEDANREGCLRALSAGAAVLSSGGSAEDAVEAAVRVLESEPTFNAGRGSAQNELGEIEMCAALMEGRDHKMGAVTVVRDVEHPISIARRMLEETPVLLAGEGARRYAAARDLIGALASRDAAGERAGHDTVGCVARDGNGHFAVGTSTGGLDGAPKGRIGDSPLPGAGFYVDDMIGEVVFSGDGEEIARKILAARVIFGAPLAGMEAAVSAAVGQVAAMGAEAGGLALAQNGDLAWAHNSREFPVAYMSGEAPHPQYFLRTDHGEA